jgi:tetratricopeptide (TPR) repeat protein
LAKHRDAVDADLATEARPEAPPRPQPPPITAAHPAAIEPNRQDGREAVRNAFAAKQSAPASKLPLWLALGTLGIAAIAIGAYVWFQLNSMNNSALAPASARAPATSSALQPRPLPTAPVSLPPAMTTSVQPTVVEAPEPRQFTPPPASRPARAPLAEREPARDTSIHLARTRPEPDASLLSGHANVQRNDLDTARQDFERSLQRDPNNTDAMLAIAAIAHRQGRPADAENMYQRALIANPSNPAVQAAVLNGAVAGADPQTTESRLKTLLANQPESAPLNFALGNLYARQKRWAEAQQVYFNAVAGENDNPDYLFNLAVSLDHIRQAKPAAQHYRLALEAAEKRPAAFDREQVRKRLAELQP